jgi:hypothetical protein
MAWKRWRLLACGAGAAMTVTLGLSACTAGAPYLVQPTTSGAAYGDAVTATRAGYVRMMLSNYMSVGPLDIGGLDQVVQGYGGGYLLSLSAAGAMYSGTEQHTTDVLLGVTSVQDHMQGEGNVGAAAVECYQYRIGYYPYLVSYAPIACPAPDSLADEEQGAGEWGAGLAAAQQLQGDQPGTVPASLAQAEALLAPVQRRVAAAAGAIKQAGPENQSDFAIGIDRLADQDNGTAFAALAVPLSNGTCAYVRFGYLIETDGTRRLSFGGAISPWRAACTGRAALAAVAPFSVDPSAGG